MYYIHTRQCYNIVAGFELTDEVICNLAEVIEKSGKIELMRNHVIFHRLTFADCQLTDSGAAAIAKAISKNTSITVSNLDTFFDIDIVSELRRQQDYRRWSSQDL
jgi:hypothetical protein